MLRKTFTINGKRYDITGKTQRELDDKYFHIRLEAEQSSVGITVEEYCGEWLERYKKPHIIKRNYNCYVHFLETHIYPYIGDKPLSSVTRIHCQEVLNTMRGYSDFYINKMKFTLNNIFKMAVADGYINSNPAEFLTKPKGHTTSRRSLTDEERQVLLQTIKGKRYELYFKLMLFCGLRPHECALVQGKDIKENVLHIRGIKSRNADRYVPIPPFLGLPDLDDEQFLFYHLTEQKRKRWWESLKRELGNVSYSPYCLRHTYCTDLEVAGIPINVARQLMGHSDISLTSKIYTHTNSTVWNAAITSMESLWKTF